MSVLQAHSFLWHYLWIAPHVLQIVLAIFLWRRGLYRLFPFFFFYLLFEAVEEFVLYGMDISPSVSGEAFWRTFSVGLVIEGVLKFAIICELFLQLVRRHPSVADLGRRLLTTVGAVLLLTATLTAAFAPMGRPIYGPMFRAHLLLQSFYIIQCGLILFLFLFATHFHLSWNRWSFGIALGFAIVFCQHMAAWAVMVSGIWADTHRIVEFLNAATYHLCVLIWFYYLLIPQKSPTTSAVSLPDNNLAVWNRELERLLQQ